MSGGLAQSSGFRPDACQHAVLMPEGLASIGGSSEGQAEHGLPGGDEKVAQLATDQDRTQGIGIDQAGEVQDDRTDLGSQARVVGHREPTLQDGLESWVPNLPPSEIDQTDQIRWLVSFGVDHLSVEPTQGISQELGKAVVVMMERPARDTHSITDFD